MGLFGGNDSDSGSEPELNLSDEQYEKIERLVENRQHVSISKDSLTEIIGAGGYIHKPVIEHIHSGEEVIMILRGGGQNSVKIGRDEKEPIRKGEILYILTHNRLLIIVPEDEKDSEYEILYEEINGIDGKEQSGFLSNGYVIKIKSDDKYYQLELRDEPHSESFIDLLREKTHDEFECVLVSPQYDNMAQIEVIDRETGEAKMESKGWNYGISFIERTKSDAVIEKEGYEMEAIDIVIKSKHLLMEATQPNGERVTMKRRYEDIGAVDETSRGFIAYCSDGIYKIDWGMNRSLRHSDRISKIQNTMRNKVEGSKKSPDENGVEESELDKLEKLAELKEDGVITEEEFEQKKEKLLDEI
ncbi:SHOCT domain-containing protein [Halobacterium hubeiense]|uniref:SHOCT domain-containing protein n=1 Tax=Halobacterium hubeiense TaxID=1407499 RepID=UPI003C75918C